MSSGETARGESGFPDAIEPAEPDGDRVIGVHRVSVRVIPDGKLPWRATGAAILAARDCAVTAERPTGEYNMADTRGGSLSGLTEQEAKEFHSIFLTSFIIFMVICDRRPLPRLAVASVAAGTERLRIP